jgi:protein-arginine kinase activator protein McsA
MKKQKEKCISCGKKADWKYFKFDDTPNILYKRCPHCSCLLIGNISWRFLNGIDFKDLTLSFTKKLRKELLEKKNKLLKKEKSKKESCPLCGKKMQEFKSVRKIGPGGSKKWWKCRKCRVTRHY